MARRGIPPVRSWLVKAYDENDLEVDRAVVRTINRDFARYVARVELGWWGRRISASVLPRCTHGITLKGWGP
jgi:hypothetical protein